MQSHENLEVWKKSVQLSVFLYRVTEKFPTREMYGLSAQIRRAAVPVPSNIAEGRRRRTDADFLHFLHIAYGSLAEIETQILIAKELLFCEKRDYENTLSLTTELGKMLHGMMIALR